MPEGLDNQPNSRYPAIVAEIRKWIVSGRVGPGDRLPNRTELEGSFQASRVTVQKALNRLASDGFVRATPRGTFVGDRPPHLNRFAVAYPSTPGETHGWSQYWTSFSHELHAVQESLGIQVVSFYDITGHVDTESFQQLLAEARDQKLAGVILVDSPWWLKDYPDGIGAPVISLVPDDHNPDLCALRLDMDLFFERAFEEVVRRGLRKVAILGTVGCVDGQLSSETAKVAETFGLEIRQHWVVPLSGRSPLAACQATELLMRLAPEDRPEAMIITDDHLVERASRGLLLQKVNVPGEFLVIAHANFPVIPSVHVPVKWLGFDMRELALESIESLRMNRATSTRVVPRALRPLFEHELPSGRINRLGLGLLPPSRQKITHR